MPQSTLALPQAQTWVQPRCNVAVGSGHRSYRLLVAASLMTLTVLLLAWTAPEIGLTWDEPTYMEAGTSYAGWLTAFKSDPVSAIGDTAITAAWEINHEHPPIDKLWSGLIWQGTSGLLDDITAHRLGNMLLAGLMSGVLYLMVAEQCGDVAGLMAVGATLSMPRLFFHAHLAALDFPAAVGTLAVTYLFWRTRQRSGFRWSIWLGVTYALAAGMKVTALFEIPIVLVVWITLFERRMWILGRLLEMVVVGFVVWLLLWPWLYHDTLQRVVEYFKFMTVDHYAVGQWYRNHFYAPPPWHYPFVITLAVVPAITTVLAGLGVVAAVRRYRAFGGLLVIGALVPILIMASGKSQVFDGERMWLPSFLFIGALAGVGFVQFLEAIGWAAHRIGRPSWVRPIAAGVALVALLPQTVAAADLFPNLLSYYSEAVGGLRGATRLGLETTYWTDTYGLAVPYLNTYAPVGATVWVEAHDPMIYYQHAGYLRPDLRIGSPRGDEGVNDLVGYVSRFEDADVVVVEYRQSGLDGSLRQWMAQRTPVYQRSYGGTPLMEIYAR